MKVTDDELIRKLLDADSKVKIPVYGIDPVNFAGAYRIHVSRDALIAFAHELIALAQEVEPLVWETRSKESFCAYSPVGFYTVWFAVGVWYALVQGETIGQFINEAEAKEAAQQDYARRVKSGLKYGGGDEPNT